MSEAYQVIARRWRPKQFSELVGQDHIVRTLSNAIDLNRIAHAYLFVGPRGTGKTSAARLFAKSLNWEDGPSIETSESTEICDAIMRGECLDVIEIDGASNNGVEQVRALREECAYAPALCRFKIYIIDEVHMLSTAAFNALLKTLEEPPAHVKFIFATTEAQKVLPTITSRCQRFEFRSIPQKTIAEKLAIICEAEGINASPEALDIIAHIAEGGMRDSQSTLDQLIAFCGKTIKKEDVLDVYGIVDPQRISTLASTMLAGDYKALLDQISLVADEGRDLYRLLRDLRDHFRGRLVKTAREGGSHSADEISRVLDVLHEGEKGVQGGLSQLVNFESVLLKAVEQGRSRAIDTLIREITTLSKSLPLDEAAKKKLNAPSPDQSPQTENQAPLIIEEDKPALPQQEEPEPHIEPEAVQEPKPGYIPEPEYTEEVPLSPELRPEDTSHLEPGLHQQKEIEIQKRVDALPEDFRQFLDDNFRAKFVAIRDMDQKKLR
jgi:DNA polymerase-3 subunit gamma/tau